MSRALLAVPAAMLLAALGVASASGQAPRTSAAPVSPVASHGAQTPTVESQTALVKQYCATCHNDRMKAGELSLASFDASTAEQHAERSEKMIRKLRTGMMPPPGARRPDEPTLMALASFLETRIDRAAETNPNPGYRPFQRLNRAEYATAVRDLLGIDADVSALLPPDTISHGFDNIADVQAFSPTVLEGYLRAAARISRDAIGDPAASPSGVIYKVPRTAAQLRHVPGAPIGTRGGTAVTHIFPADGEYTFRVMFHSIPTGQLYGSTTRDEQIEISIDGERVALLDINPRISEADPKGISLETAAVHVKAGPRRLAAAFIARSESPVDDLLAPVDYTLADTQIGAALGVTTLPHLRELAVTGPHKVTGVSETVSRRRVFTCRPTSPAEEAPCAERILRGLASQAFRRPVGGDELRGLMAFYATGRNAGDFEIGIRTGLQAILASPQFLLRLERAPAGVKPGETYRISDIDLASRLSYFLWGTVPDERLVELGLKRGLRAPGVLEAEVRRLLSDPRAAALATRFAAQWLRLQDLDKIHPDALTYPTFDHYLAEAMRRETELVFEAIVQEDRSVLELLTADWTFVNERLARHYGMANITGDHFRRVTLTDENRRGILGHGSVLMMTSVADRTSPVNRGKWVMEVLLGSPPPPPPANVPALEETAGVADARLLSVRERLEQHRANPTCNSCHRMIDPLGLALENFDVTGAWRIKDNGVPVDPSGTLYDGTPLTGPIELRRALVKRADVVLLSFTESLMTYALGRRIEPFDMPAVRAIVRDAKAHDNRLSAFVLGIVKSAAFQMSRAESVETTAAPVAHGK